MFRGLLYASLILLILLRKAHGVKLFSYADSTTQSDSLISLRFSRHRRLDRITGSSSPTLIEDLSTKPELRLRGGQDGEVSALVDDAYTWCMNLGQPSALIAGAVIATIYENIGSGSLDINDEDSRATRFKKRVTRSLLLSAFGLEVVAIFVTTITGTMLLSRHLHHDMDNLVPVTEHTTPLAFMRENFEFEYLTARIAFLQGLLNWLGAIALGHLIPRDGESYPTRIMNKCIGSALFTLIALMLEFYNTHMSFYRNYGEMLNHWIRVSTQRFFWPPRFMSIIYIPASLSTLYWGYLSFFNESSLSVKKENKVEVKPVPRKWSLGSART